jgi:hypothetical protein
MITTKAIASPSSRFLSIWTRIEQHSSLRKLQQNNKPQLLPFNSVPAMREAQQHFWCAALVSSNSYLETPKTYDPIRSRLSAFQCPTEIGSVWRSWPAMSFASKKRVQATEQDLQGDDGQEDDHDKGDRRSIRLFPIAVDTHRQHSSLRKLQNRYALVVTVPTACQQCTKHSNIVDRSRLISFRTRDCFYHQGSSPIRIPSINVASKRRADDVEGRSVLSVNCIAGPKANEFAAEVHQAGRSVSLTPLREHHNTRLSPCTSPRILCMRPS